MTLLEFYRRRRSVLNKQPLYWVFWWAPGPPFRTEKVYFFTVAIDNHMHTIRSWRLKISAKTTDAIHVILPPTNVIVLRSFLDLCNVYPLIVPSVSKIATPVNENLKIKEKSKSFELDITDLPLMEQLNQTSTFFPVLALPNQKGRVIIETDVCEKQVGCVLQQEQDDRTLRIIRYRSHTYFKCRWKTIQHILSEMFGSAKEQYCYCGLTLKAVDLQAGQIIKHSNSFWT